MAKKKTEIEEEAEVEDEVEEEAAPPVGNQTAYVSPPIAAAPEPVYNPVSSIVRVEIAPALPQPRLTRASHAHYRRIFQMLRSLGKSHLIYR